ncbi:sensor histidine kinase [Luteimonas kalidii]|uniref:histidine kinase n=1 Tax=Luteimonas kalidii TaxID=3042025 RepID=A0ABT6JQQ1_9GAMM|nr:HAMP domain-containing sensor histidine kinase [Luteimonas kalidii]MDH5832813.1 HAMP domain-containing sensor histidine kinase [Luteimonas kalidii]
MATRWDVAMRPPSLVGRLLLSALLGMLAAGVVAMAIFAAFEHLRGTDYEVHKENRDDLTVIEREILAGQFDPQQIGGTWFAGDYDALRRDTAFRVLDATGRVVVDSPPGPALEALERMPPGGDRVELQGDGPPVVLQVAERRVSGDDGGYVIQVARSHRMEQRLAEHARSLYRDSAIVAALGALGVFTIVIYLTIRRAVGPLQQASELAARINPRTVSARLRTEGMPSEMIPLIDALNLALQRLEHGLRVQQDFLATAAHELKTPLTLLRAEIELGEGMDRAAMLHDTELMGRQVHQLLHLAEVSEDRNYRFARLSLWSLAQEAGDYMKRVAEKGGVVLQIERHGREARVDADAGAVFVLLKNLLENAIGHTPKGNRVTLEVSPAGFAVADQGTGIAAGDRAHLFERFWRASTTTSGAGLGLAIVSEICLAHQWTVTAEVADGGGARFVVSIPEAQVHA